MTNEQQRNAVAAMRARNASNASTRIPPPRPKGSKPVLNPEEMAALADAAAASKYVP
jgi:hypothetical protein